VKSSAPRGAEPLKIHAGACNFGCFFLLDYFLVTFTLPAQLRGFAWHHLRWTCHTLFQVAQETLNQFARNDKRLGDQLGLVGVLHTYSRRLAFHPHVHLVVPGAG